MPPPSGSYLLLHFTTSPSQGVPRKRDRAHVFTSPAASTRVGCRGTYPVAGSRWNLAPCNLYTVEYLSAKSLDPGSRAWEEGLSATSSPDEILRETPLLPAYFFVIISLDPPSSTFLDLPPRLGQNPRPCPRGDGSSVLQGPGVAGNCGASCLTMVYGLILRNYWPLPHHHVNLRSHSVAVRPVITTSGHSRIRDLFRPYGRQCHAFVGIGVPMQRWQRRPTSGLWPTQEI